MTTPRNVATGQALAPITLGSLAGRSIKVSPDGKTAYLSALSGIAEG